MSNLPDFNSAADDGSTDIDVFMTDDLIGHEDKMQRVCALLEQSGTARLLLRCAVRGGYGVAMDAGMVDRGGADFEQKIIFLRPDAPMEELALTLAHELAHVSQKENANLDIDVLRDTPRQSMRVLMAMEADARAHEMRVALELSYGAAAKPDMLDALVAKSENPLLAALVDKARPLLPADVSFDKMMAGAFKCFYGYAPNRRTHEDIILNKLVQCQSAGGKREDRTGAKLMQLIDNHACPYLPKDGYIDLAAANFDEPTAEGLAGLARIAKYSSAKTTKSFKLP